MALIDTYRSNVTRKRGELSKLTSDRAKESAKKAQQKQKIVTATNAIKSTKSQSTIKSKLSEIDRAEKEIASIEKRLQILTRKSHKKMEKLHRRRKM